MCASGRHRVVAIDTEHHSYESYRGFVCLLQLSTCSSAGATKDFLVDPFGLFLELPALNRLTTNPQILKVLHGAASDIIWLQVCSIISVSCFLTYGPNPCLRSPPAFLFFIPPPLFSPHPSCVPVPFSVSHCLAPILSPLFFF